MNHEWQVPPDLWQRLRPLAQQMRRQPTAAEHKLWQRLRGRKVMGIKFRRQHAIERFIVDFYAREAMLIIEVDGPVHQYQQEEDAVRQEFLERMEYRVLRFDNLDVINRTDEVVRKIEAVIGKQISSLPGPPRTRRES